MDKLRILLIEEDAQDYLKTRQQLEEQTSHFNIDWAPNYEIALKRIKQNVYDVYLMGYHASLAQQQFLTWLYDSAMTPIIFLTKPEKPVEVKWLEKIQTDCIRKDQLNSLLLEQMLHSIFKLLDLQKREKLFQSLFFHASHFLGLMKPNGMLQDINQAAARFLRLRRELAIGAFIWQVPWASHSTQTQALLKAAISTANTGEVARCEIQVPQKSGGKVAVELLLTPIIENKKVTWIIAEGRDLSEQRRLEQQLIHHALHDSLTGLPNRQAFLESLEPALARAQQTANYYIALLFIDLDRFNLINASLGHDMGDWLLMEVAQRLQNFLKSTQHALARFGGDEFIILVNNMQELNEATQLAMQINEILAAPFLLDGYAIVTSASIGIVHHSQQQDSTELLRDATAAMHRAKAIGKSCYAVFNQNMHQQALTRLKTEMDLCQALAKNNFVLFYQPQTKLGSEQLIGSESSIGVFHPHNGLTSTLNLKMVLEETSITNALGEWMLRTACRQLRTWWNSGLVMKRIAVNLSAQQFRNKQLFHIVADSLKTADLEPSALELEFTESSLLENIESAVGTLKCFKDMGIRVTIDDFGTGYASLSYLKRFPADGLKIAHSFIKGIPNSPEDVAITVATIDMAHALGLTVIAEGVETAEQRDFLRDHGCDFAQGYLYAPPLEDAAFLEWGKQYNKIVNGEW
jgi:diguanylate cyclase (GGDEF)-like protein/PAS domain S-box-containing protein